MKKYIFLLTVLFHTFSYGSIVEDDAPTATVAQEQEGRVAYWAPYYVATKEYPEDRTVTLKILACNHTLSSKIVPENIMHDIMDSSLLLCEINAPCLCPDDERIVAPSEVTPEVPSIDVALDCLFHEKSRVTPETLLSNYLSETPDIANPSSLTAAHFESHFRWSQLITFEDKINLLSILNDLLKEKKKEDYIETLHHNGLNSLNADMLDKVLGMRLDSLGVNQSTQKPPYGLDFHLSGTMDSVIFDNYLNAGKRVLSFETGQDRAWVEQEIASQKAPSQEVAPSSLSFQEKLEEMRKNIWPDHCAKNLHKKLSSGDFKIMDGKVIPTIKEVPYKTRPAFTTPHSDLSEKYFSCALKPCKDPEVILRNEMWCDRLMQALEIEGSEGIKDNSKISITVGSAHLLGPGNFLELLEKSGFLVENRTSAISYCEDSSVYSSNLYCGKADVLKGTQLFENEEKKDQTSRSSENIEI
ncbi:MAG: TraB/GumN family protein [bacterium]|nr:TraB/GumN family protein [bacterium]